MGCYEKKYKKILFTIFAGILIISWIYYFPLQHFFAQRKYQEYAKRHGIVNDIQCRSTSVLPTRELLEVSRSGYL